MPLPALLAHAAALLLATLAAPDTGSAPDSSPARPPDPVVALADARWPLEPVPEVLAGFDPPDSRWGAGHRGADLAGRPGQPVLAALPGRVGFAGEVAGKPVVTVVHGDHRTTYEPVVATVARGEEVAAGDVIGRLVLTDGHCLPAGCLHWGLRRGDDYLDPLSLLGGGPVRLLPLWQDGP